jgi:hybrid cluster-associated redox disulfide protein
MINREMSIKEIVENHPECAAVLDRYNMGCARCLAASFETIEEGINAHGLNVDEIISELNNALKG